MYPVQKINTNRANELSCELAALTGVHEALVMANEGVAYLKVDLNGFDEKQVIQLLKGEM